MNKIEFTSENGKISIEENELDVTIKVGDWRVNIFDHARKLQVAVRNNYGNWILAREEPFNGEDYITTIKEKNKIPYGEEVRCLNCEL